MIIVEKIIGNIYGPEGESLKAGRVVDKVLLDSYDLARPHQKVRSVAGQTLAVSLPHGHRLFHGAVLYRDEKKVTVTELLPEDVLVIYPNGNLQWAETAFNIGNMHQSAFFGDDCILTAYDAIVEKLLKDIGVKFERCKRQLTGKSIGRTVAGHGHTHSHG